MTEEAEFLTYVEAAARAGKSVATIRIWVRAGLLKRYRRPTKREVYVRSDEVDRVLQGPPRED